MFQLFATVTNTQNATTELVHSTTPSFLRLGLSFIALLAALWFVIWLLKKISGSKLGFFNHDSNIKMIERKSISPKTQLYVIEFEGQKMIVAESSVHVKFKDLQTDIEQS